MCQISQTVSEFSYLFCINISYDICTFKESCYNNNQKRRSSAPKMRRTAALEMNEEVVYYE